MADLDPVVREDKPVSDDPSVPDQSVPAVFNQSTAEIRGIPGSRINVTQPLTLDGERQDLGAAIHASVVRVSSQQEAQAGLEAQRHLGLVPDNPEQLKAVQEQQKSDDLDYKLNQLPRLKEYMLRSPYHAGAVAEEADKWGVLDWVFGKYVPDPNAEERSRQIAAGKPYTADKGYYEPPGWQLAFGRAAYATGTSVQTWAQMVWGGGKPLDKIAQQQDVASAPVPGDDNFVLGKANSLIGMAPLMAAAVIHPALAWTLMYTETTGRSYEGLRLSGYDHETAAPIANLIGFTSAHIASAMGPMFSKAPMEAVTRGSLVGLSNAMLVSMTAKPTLWRGLLGLGQNFVANTAMNVAMATSEASIREAFDSSKEGRAYDYSRVASHAAAAADSWAEMMALSVIPAYENHKANLRLYDAKPEATYEVAKAKLAEQVRENYEQRGLAVMSLYESSKIVAAVNAIKDSPFMKENPQEARALIQQMVAPRESQTVFVSPEALEKMPADKLAALGNPDLSIAHAGGNVPVNIVDFLMHPDAESLARHTAGGPDLLTLQEATGVDLSVPPVTGADVSDENLDAYLAEQRTRARDRRQQPRIPTGQEILSGVQQAALGNGARRSAPDPGSRFKAEVKGESVAMPPATAAGLDRWATDAVSRLPSRELESFMRSQEALRDQHSAAALEAQESATQQAQGGTGGAAEAQEAAQAKRRSQVAGALYKASKSAAEALRGIGDGLAAAASDGENGQPSGREKAWAAGQVYGEAFDAITENLGLAARKRGYAAPDLSDAHASILRARDQLTDRLLVAPGQEFDVGRLNRMLRQPNDIGDLTLSELTEVNKAMRQIAEAADNENTIRYNGLRVAKDWAKNEIAEHLKSIPDRPRGQRPASDQDEALTRMEKAKKGAAAVAAVMNQPHTLMFKLGKIGDDLWFEGFVSGVARENRLWGDIHPQLKSIYESMPAGVRDSGKDVVPNPQGATEKFGVHTRSSVWHLALHMGVEGADEKIAAGLGIKTEALHDWVQANIAKDGRSADIVMKNLIEPHWKLFNGVWEEYERHFKERGIAPPEKLQPRKLTVWGEQYEGGYGGRLQWFDAVDKPILHPGSLEALLDSGFTALQTHAPHLTERDPSFKGVPVLNWSGVADSLRKEVHDIALRGFVEDAHKIFSDGKIRDLVASKLGNAALDQIYKPSGSTDWLHTVARGSVADVSSARALTKGVMQLQGLAAYSAFSLNAKVLFGQLSHLVAASPALGISPLHVGMGTSAAFDPYRRAWAHQESEVLRLRYADYQSRAEELQRQMTGVSPPDGTIRTATDHVNWMAWREMDAFLSHSIWEMAYAKATAQYQIGKAPMEHHEAVRFADKAVTEMMPAQDIYDQSAFVRDRSFVGLSFLVRNFPNTLLNVSVLNWWNAAVEGGGIGKRTWNKSVVAAQYIGMVMAAELLGKGYLMHLGPRDGEDDEEWMKERALEGIAYPTMLSGPALGLYHAASGQTSKVKDDFARMMPPSIQVAADAIIDIGRMAQAGDEASGVRAGAHLLGLSTRSPIPGKLFDLYNAARYSESGPDALKKGMGYR